jgi:hypothetical protein
MLLSERSSVLSTVETLGLAMQGSGDDGEEGVPVSRGQGGGAVGAA